MNDFTVLLHKQKQALLSINLMIEIFNHVVENDTKLWYVMA